MQDYFLRKQGPYQTPTTVPLSYDKHPLMELVATHHS